MSSRNDVGSIAVDRSSHPHHFRLFSAASFRRKLLATLSCAGCSSSSAKKHPSKSDPIIRKETGPGSSGRSGSETLGDLFIETREPDDVRRRKKEERLEELRMAVRLVRSEAVEERENGAKLIRRLAKEDAEARTSLALIGAIPPLVGMIAIDDDDDDLDDGDQSKSKSESESTQIEALYALLNLGIGNDLNKAAIVQAGALHKMLHKIKSSNGSPKPAISEAIVANLLALSALDTNKPIIGSSGAIPFLVSILQDSDNNNNNNNCSSEQAKQDALKALYNLSISSPNIPLIVNTGVIHHLVTLLGDMEMSERTLAILSNVVLNSEGRRSISNVPEVFPILIDVLNWTDSPGCQEKASYILMIMAHKSYTDRQRMIDAGIGSALLELTLLGSTLAQKRASRLLECLRVDKGKQRVSRNFTGAVSAPICGPPSSSSSASGTKSLNKEDEAMMSEEKKAVKELVQQSLQNNMKRIVKRANLPQEFVPSEHLKSLTVSSTSKSLPF